MVSRTAGGEGRDSFRSFPFERVFGPADSQDVVYRAAAADVVENSLEGFKGTIVAYGATGSGGLAVERLGFASTDPAFFKAKHGRSSGTRRHFLK